MAERSDIILAGVISRFMLKVSAFNLGLASSFCLSVASYLACGHCTSVAGRVKLGGVRGGYSIVVSAIACLALIIYMGGSAERRADQTIGRARHLHAQINATRAGVNYSCLSCTVDLHIVALFICEQSGQAQKRAS